MTPKKHVYETEFGKDDKFYRVLFERLCKIQDIKKRKRTVRPLKAVRWIDGCFAGSMLMTSCRDMKLFSINI